MKKANVDKLNALHGLIAEYYEEAIKIALEEGEELSSGTLNAINNFLKTNDITADVMESQPLQNLQYRIADLVKQEEEMA
jgi:hypothetical protein